MSTNLISGSTNLISESTEPRVTDEKCYPEPWASLSGRARFDVTDKVAGLVVNAIDLAERHLDDFTSATRREAVESLGGPGPGYFNPRTDAARALRLFRTNLKRVEARFAALKTLTPLLRYPNIEERIIRLRRADMGAKEPSR